jgi:hypothetical protein
MKDSTSKIIAQYGVIPEVSKWFRKFAPVDATTWKESPDKARSAAILARFVYSDIDGVSLPRLNSEKEKTPAANNKKYLSFIISTYKKMSSKAKSEYVSLASSLLWQE